MSNDSLERALGRLEGGMKGIEGKIDLVLERQDGHEKRLAKVERWQAKLAGAIALASFVVGLVVKALM